MFAKQKLQPTILSNDQREIIDQVITELESEHFDILEEHGFNGTVRRMKWCIKQLRENVMIRDIIGEETLRNIIHLTTGKYINDEKCRTAYNKFLSEISKYGLIITNESDGKILK